MTTRPLPDLPPDFDPSGVPDPSTPLPYTASPDPWTISLERNRGIWGEISDLYPWLPPALVEIYVDEYIESGDATLAWARVRQSDVYDTYFPGMKRDDGTLRLPDEQAYFALMTAYANVFSSYGLNADLFREHFVTLLEGDVSADELDRDRIAPVYERVIDSSPAIQADYAARWGLELTPEAILASVLDPALGEQIINRQVAISEIAGEAAESGFGISDELVESLYRAGTDREEADRLFSAAANVVPVLSTLARRHADPDDDFDLGEFLSSEVFADPRQRRRMRRLLAQERSLFANVGAQVAFERQTQGGITGLRQR